MPEGDRQTKTLLKAGDRVGRYAVTGLLGRGGMGEVYAAENRRTGRKVALKIVRSLDATPEQNRRFLREAKTATAIDHPNVIDVLDAFEDDDGAPVMVMELLRGESLAHTMERLGVLSLSQLATVLMPVLGALKAAHDKGIVHRDLKPDNIFLSRGPAAELVPKVLDFGIAKILDPGAIAAETQGTGAPTHTGSIMGTPHYMSYEQAMSEKDIDARADIWSVGVIVFEALSGRRPLEFENLGQMYTMLLKSEVPSLREHAPDLPNGVIALVDRCLVKERDERLDDLAPLIDELAKHASSDAVASLLPAEDAAVAALALPLGFVASSGQARTPSSMLGRALVVVAVLAIAGTAAALFGQSGGSAESSAAESGADASAGGSPALVTNPTDPQPADPPPVEPPPSQTSAQTNTSLPAQPAPPRPLPPPPQPAAPSSPPPPVASAPAPGGPTIRERDPYAAPKP